MSVLRTARHKTKNGTTLKGGDGNPVQSENCKTLDTTQRCSKQYGRGTVQVDLARQPMETCYVVL